MCYRASIKGFNEMKQTILLTGATDGIGFETAKKLVSLGHTVLLHGRNIAKLTYVKNALTQLNHRAIIDTYHADLSHLSEVELLANTITQQYHHIDVLINNAGVFKTPQPITDEGYDARFVVNTIAPYLLTTKLLPLLSKSSRIVNVSSAAQASVNLAALRGEQKLTDGAAYAQSKLALLMWTFQLAKTLGANAPTLIAVNPASFLGSKMVKEAYGSEGKDLTIGADILVQLALSTDFLPISGSYFDNDIGQWAQPHPDALSAQKNASIITVINEIQHKLKLKLKLTNTQVSE